MSILKKVLNELSPYGEMGLPDGETSQGIGNNDSQTKNTKLTAAYKLQKLARNHPDHPEERNANDSQSMNDRLRHHARAEDEEEGDMNFDMGGGEDYPSDDEMGGMEDEMNQTSMNDHGDMEMDDMAGEMNGDVDVEEVRNFFTDNPSPSDEEIAQYAGERGIEMDQLRQEVYALIQSLLDVEGGEEMGMDDMGDEQGVDDMDGMSSDEDMSAGEEDMGDDQEQAGTKFDFSSGIDDDEFEIRSKLR